jgi:hypothetical protein
MALIDGDSSMPVLNLNLTWLFMALYGRPDTLEFELFEI